MLDTQCSPKTPNNKEGFEHAQSCVLIIELPSDQQSNGHTQKRLATFNHIASLVALVSGTDLLNIYTRYKQCKNVVNLSQCVKLIYCVFNLLFTVHRQL